MTVDRNENDGDPTPENMTMKLYPVLSLLTEMKEILILKVWL